ncbi:hypothetical protein [Paenibacillus sp. EZ-K15]|uniref:hypothetical protein n=1 Tax=Paenibacillus sp. EZ-K15 TaxID=2044275 RepID=UPI000BF49F1C|nr:hypothetical protein [Paenibacillus sp. EZ-K15]
MDKERMVQELEGRIRHETLGAAKSLNSAFNKSRILNITAVLISALITIVSGVEGLPFSSHNIVIVLGATLTAFGSIKTFFNFEKQIENLSVTFHDFRSLGLEFQIYCNTTELSKIDENRLNEFENRFRAIYTDHANRIKDFRKMNQI